MPSGDTNCLPPHKLHYEESMPPLPHKSCCQPIFTTLSPLSEHSVNLCAIRNFVMEIRAQSNFRRKIEAKITAAPDFHSLHPTPYTPLPTSRSIHFPKIDKFVRILVYPKGGAAPGIVIVCCRPAPSSLQPGLRCRSCSAHIVRIGTKVDTDFHATFRRNCRCRLLQLQCPRASIQRDWRCATTAKQNIRGRNIG